MIVRIDGYFSFFVAECIPDVEHCKASIKTRCSTLRYNKVVKDCNPIQRGHIIKYGLEHLLNIPEHLYIPLNSPNGSLITSPVEDVSSTNLKPSNSLRKWSTNRFSE